MKPNFRIGMTAVEVVVEIVRTKSFINKLAFYIYNPHYTIEEIRRNTRKKNLFVHNLVHHDPSVETVILKRDEITADNLERIIKSLKEDSVLGVLSKVYTPEIEWRREPIPHIPMIDFICRESPRNLAKVEQFLRLIGQEKGVILASGRSYHYYGTDNCMQVDAWLNFLGDCGLSELVDSRYIFHRLKDENQRGILRLSACPLRPIIPTVVSIL